MLEVNETFTTIWLSRSSEVRVKVRRWPQSPIGTIFYKPDALPATQPTASKHWRHLSVWSEVQIICIWSSWCHCYPSLASLKSSMVYLFDTGLPRLYCYPIIIVFMGDSYWKKFPVIWQNHNDIWWQVWFQTTVVIVIVDECLFNFSNIYDTQLLCWIYLLYILLWFCQAIIHPDTGEKIFMPFRMSGKWSNLMYTKCKVLIFIYFRYRKISCLAILCMKFE